MEDNSVWWLRVVLTGGVNIGFATLAGCVTSLWILRSAKSPWALSCAGTVGVVLRAAVAWSVIATALAFWTQAAEMSEQPLLLAFGFIGSVLTQTHVGHAWSLGGVALLILTICLLRRKQNGVPRYPVPWMVACLIAFAFSKSWASHAEATGELLPLAVDLIHLLSASLWAGAAFVSASAVLRSSSLRSMAERRECASYVDALSSTATWALTAVVLTGVASSWRSLGGFADPIFSTPYGGLLSGKVGLVGIAVALGAYNRLAVMPHLLLALRKRKLAFDVPLRTFERVLQLESLVLLAILIAAATLTLTTPPGH